MLRIKNTAKNNFVKIKVDSANDLWIAVEKKSINEAISWFIQGRGKKGDHSFQAIPNLADGVMEIRKVIA